MPAELLCFVEEMADHKELVAALRARDADRAVDAMRVHLARGAGHLFDETQ